MPDHQKALADKDVRPSGLAVAPCYAPFFEDEWVTIYCGDAREIVPTLAYEVIVSDPPYGIAYRSGSSRDEDELARSIEGDETTELRDWLCALGKPTLCFGTWKVAPPAGTRETLVWDKKGALGMGALDIPWKRSWEEIYVLGKGFFGRREGAVLQYPPVQSMSRNGRIHPHQKPVMLMEYLVDRCPQGVILDPFMGSGTTLRAAKNRQRRAIGIEIDERYCKIAADRMRQDVLRLSA